MCPYSDARVSGGLRRFYSCTGSLLSTIASQCARWCRSRSRCGPSCHRGCRWPRCLGEGAERSFSSHSPRPDRSEYAQDGRHQSDQKAASGSEVQTDPDPHPDHRIERPDEAGWPCRGRYRLADQTFRPGQAGRGDRQGHLLKYFLGPSYS